MKTRTRHVVCWVEAGFDALDVASFCQVLSEAGSTWNWRAYRIEFVSRTGGLIASNAQLELNTAPMAAAQPDVVIVASGRQATPAEMPDPWRLWSSPHVEWVGLRAGLLALLSTGRFQGATVAASPRFQPRLLAVEPSLQFSSKPWHVHERLWSCASADATDAALALLQRHVGNTARRAVETALGLSTTFPAVNVDVRQFVKSE